MKTMSVGFFTGFFAALFFVFPSPVSLGNEEQVESAPQEDIRGTDALPGKSWDEAWRGFFGRDLPDPLEQPDQTSEEWMREREQAEQRGHAAAEFADAATTVVTAGMPTPSGAVGAGATTAAGRAVMKTASTAAGATTYATGEIAE